MSINEMNLLTAKEVSEIIKAKPSTVYAWAEQGILPCYKLNGLLRFSESDISAWIKNCKKELPKSYNISADKRPRKGG